jgi:hypothetical protein
VTSQNPNSATRPLVICIALRGYHRFFRKCIDTQRLYCRNHNYDYRLINRIPYRLPAADASWLKIPIILEALNAGRPWVMTIDADCEIRTETPELESLHRSGKSVYMALGHSRRINAGVIIVANTAQAHTLFSTILEHSHEPVPRAHRAAYENGHVIHFATNHDAVCLLEHRLWNNNSSFDASSYIQHYTGDLRPYYLQNRATKIDLLILRLSFWLQTWERRRVTGSLQARLQQYLKAIEPFG